MLSVRRSAVLISVIVVMSSLQVFSMAAESAPKAKPATASVRALLGRWDLTLKTPEREYPSWLELSEQGGKLQALFVSRWGHARPLPKVEFAGGQLTFVSPKEEEDRKDDMVFTGKLVGNKLVGTTTGPDGTPWQWTGVRAPSLKRSNPPKWGAPVKLFDGKDLRGWHMSDPKLKPWTVENGALVSPEHGAEIISDRKFEDF